MDGFGVGMAEEGIFESGKGVGGLWEGTESRDEHEKGRAGEVKVRQECIYSLEFIWGIDKDIRRIRSGSDTVT